MIKCFERSTVERIKENSNEVSRCLFILLLIANANGVGRVEKKARQGGMASGEDGETRKKPSVDFFYCFQTLRQPSKGVSDWSICAPAMTNS